MKSRYILIFLMMGTFLVSSCKTKQELVKEDEFKKTIDKRGQQLGELADEVGLDSDVSAQLVDDVKGVDTDLMNFLATDPSNEERSKMLREFLDQREGKIRGAMTEEQYIAYRKALLAKTKKKAEEEGKPLVTPNG